MFSFTNYYRVIYETFGYPLTERTCTPSTVIAASERRLGRRLPAALRDFYLVAGQERRFNQALNRVLAPESWFLDKQRVVFMEENQSVAWWGVSIRNAASDDPPVSQGMNDEPIIWRRQHRKCSVFLAVMLHYQAVNGGLRFSAMATAPADAARLLRNGWTYYGEVNKLRAYSRQNQVVCLSPFMDTMCLFAGAKTKPDLRTMAKDLHVRLNLVPQ